jgi:hypothetical protein
VRAPLSTATKKELARWAHMWFCTAELQQSRILSAGTELRTQDMDMNQFVWALHNAVTGAVRVLTRGSKEAQAFNAAAPEVKTMRDILSHYDEYLEGRGRLQWPESTPAKDRKPQPFKMGIMSQGDGHQHEAVFLTHRSEPDGSIHALSVIVDTATSMKACAHLIEAALKAAGITSVSETVEKVKKQ